MRETTEQILKQKLKRVNDIVKFILAINMFLVTFNALYTFWFYTIIFQQ